jgi:hypothetical protein
MLRAALTTFGRLGVVGALLLALATVALPVEGQACAPGSTEAAATAIDVPQGVQTDPCDTDGCGDCGAACAHGCCHAPHVGVIAASEGPLTLATVSEAGAFPDPVALAPSSPSGLERPPRV